MQEIRLIIDGTKVGFGHQLLIICLAYRKRSIPIAWTCVKHVRGHSTAGKQLALLAYVRGLAALLGHASLNKVLVDTEPRLGDLA